MMRTNATTTSNRYQCSNCLEWKFVSQQRQRQEGVLCARCIRKEMKEILEEMDDNDKLVIRAINGPPWIKHFVIEKVEEEEK